MINNTRPKMIGDSFKGQRAKGSIDTNIDTKIETRDDDPKEILKDDYSTVNSM